MLNKFSKNIQKILKHTIQKISSFSSKSAIYLGLAIYWGIIIAGTILQAN